MDPLLKNIIAQPKVLLDNFLNYKEQVNEVAKKIENDFQGKLPFTVFTGMGASYFACQIPFNYFVIHGFSSSISETSELVYYLLPSIPNNSLVICISQSGKSIEVKNLIEKLPISVKVLTITNNIDSPAAVGSHYVLNMNIESDYSVAVNTYISSLLLSLMLAQRLVSSSVALDMKTIEDIAQKMQEWIDKRIEKLNPIIEFIGNDLPEFVAVGRGPAIASAAEAALLLKEGAKIPCMDISGGQFRHGSVEVVNSKTCVINFAPSGRTQKQAFVLTKELLDYGARVLLISDGSFGFKDDNLLEISVCDNDEFISPIYDILPCQLFAHHLAIKKGIVPGTFLNTVPVIESE